MAEAQLEAKKSLTESQEAPRADQSTGRRQGDRGRSASQGALRSKGTSALWAVQTAVGVKKRSKNVMGEYQTLTESSHLVDNLIH